MVLYSDQEQKILLQYNFILIKFMTYLFDFFFLLPNLLIFIIFISILNLESSQPNYGKMNGNGHMCNSFLSKIVMCFIVIFIYPLKEYLYLLRSP